MGGKEAKFAVDRFASGRESRLISVSGWSMLIPGLSGVPELRVDGRPCVRLLGNLRHDVAAAYPRVPFAAKAGFHGDLVVPDDVADGGSFSLSLVIRHQGGETRLADIQVVLDDHATPGFRTRSLDLGDILRDPHTGDKWQAPPGRTRYSLEEGTSIVAGIPHFHPPGILPAIRLSQTATTHPYSKWGKEFIAARGNGLVLDFGAGAQSEGRLVDNVVNLDVVHLPYVDVVNTCQDLPFRDGVFEAVISQSVFEHLRSPVRTAREILRVLRPGGEALIDTAFMQPLHGDPNHYFNMTMAGFREVLEGFDIVEMGTRPYQNPSQGIRMQIDSILPFVSSPSWQAVLKDLRLKIETSGAELDDSLGETGREVLAAGFYALARKPA